MPLTSTWRGTGISSILSLPPKGNGHPSLLLFLILFSAAACGITGPAATDAAGPEGGDLRVLFIGASYLAVNNLPGLFAGMAEVGNKQVYVAKRVQSGFYLDYFAVDQATSRAIQDHEWDYVILSGGCQTAAYPNTHYLIKEDWGNHNPLPALKRFREKVSASNPDAKLVYIMPWAFEDGMTWIPGQEDDYFAMQDSIRTHALAWADSLDLVVSPVGMAWKAIMESGVPEHYLHEGDWNHPNPRGSFLSAATLYATVFKETAGNLGIHWILDEEEARVLLQVGSTAVLDSLALWNITP